MSKTAVLAAASAVMFGAVSLATAPTAEAGGYRDRYYGGGYYYGTPYVYGGYRPYYGPYYYRPYYYPPPVYIRPPAAVYYRPFYRYDRPECLSWVKVYSRCGKVRRQCVAW